MNDTNVMNAGNTTSTTGTTSTDLLACIADILETRLPAKGGDPATSYTARLLAAGPDAFLKKIGEEATELVMAAKDGAADKIVYETADLWFHSLIVLAHFGLRPEAVLQELARRQGVSGLAEKAARQNTHASTNPMNTINHPSDREPA